MKHTRKTVVKTTLEIEESKKVMAVKQGKLDFFVSKKEYKALEKAHPRWHPVTIVEKVERQYFCKYPNQDKMFRDAFANGTTDMYVAMKKCWGNNAFHAIKRKDFNTDWLFYFNRDDHMIYGLDKDMPWSKPYRICYIGGVVNDKYNLTKAQKILEKNPYVWNVELIKIPYYNCEDNYTHSVEFSVQVPQATYNRMVRWIKKKYRENNMSSLVQCFTPHLDQLDVLGLKKALKPKDLEY